MPNALPELPIQHTSISIVQFPLPVLLTQSIDFAIIHDARNITPTMRNTTIMPKTGLATLGRLRTRCTNHGTTRPTIENGHYTQQSSIDYAPQSIES